MRNMRWRTLFLLLIPLVIAVSPISGQAGSDDIAATERLFAAARTEAVHLVAPRAYGRAEDLLEEARRRQERGGSSDGVRQALDQSAAALASAESLADRLRQSLPEAMSARAAAMDQDAAGRVATAWEEAERELERAGREAEGGDMDGVAEPAGRAVVLYQRAAEAARSDRLLGEAISARQAALGSGASQLSPSTFASGEEELAGGQAGLSAASDAEVGGHGERAQNAFLRAEWLAGLADSVLSRDVPLERFVDAHQRDLTTLATAADVTVPDLRITGSPTEEIERAVRDLLSRNADLDASLRAEKATAEQLGAQVASLEIALNDSERRYTESRSALLERERRDDRLRETSALFTPEEGEVSLTGNELVLRLHGLAFKSGSDEVDEDMSPLLTKVERVLLDFPDAVIRIEGHTDSQGNPDRNRALSQSRAIAIREYLLSRIPISSSRMEATGHGEDRPIARNDTDAGRARNRRIEITLTLPN